MWHTFADFSSCERTVKVFRLAGGSYSKTIQCPLNPFRLHLSAIGKEIEFDEMDDPQIFCRHRSLSADDFETQSACSYMYRWNSCYTIEKMGVLKESHYSMSGLPQNAIDNGIKFYAIGVTKPTFFSTVNFFVGHISASWKALFHWEMW